MTAALLKNRYRILQELGEGGFGKTLLAEDTQTPSQKKCVIKQLKPVVDNPQIYQLVKERFQREAAILEELGDQHPQIPRLYAYFAEDEEFYLVQEFIQGQTLREKIEKQGILSETEVKEILVNILPILENIQTKGIIHRDIKPDNIIIRALDSKPILIDFGAVRETMGTVINTHGNSTNSIVIGTPGFMPSEQSAGRPVFASDLYSLALTAIYLLTGKIPQDLATDVQTGEILWQQYVPNLSLGFVNVLDKAIKSHHRDRYVNAKSMAEALQSISQIIPETFIDSPNSISTTNPSVNNYSSQQSTNTNHPQEITSLVNTYSSQQSTNTNYPQQSNSIVTSGGGTFNTSVPIPPEISGWNWGAFLLSPLWCLSNQVWIGLISWIPYIGIPMPFILGAKGNTWAWRSRQWQSVQQFKAHQRGWAKAGVIVWGSFAALITVLIIIGSLLPENKDPSNPPSYPEKQTEKPQNPDVPPTPDLPPSNTTPSSLDIPPIVNIRGQNQTTTIPSPSQFIDGTWQLEFTAGDVNHTAVLNMNGREGDMVITYFDAATNKQERVSETMRLWACTEGLIVQGYNPLDADTKQPHPTYQTDQIFIEKKADGTIYIDNCSGNVCSPVTMKSLTH